MTRTIRVYSLPACPAPESADLELEALGAFPATNSTAEVLALQGAGRELRFPLGTRAIAAVAEGSSERFIGYGEAFASGDVEMVLWPESDDCVVFDEAERAGFPSRGGGQALGYAPSSGLVLAAGGDDPTSSAVVGALTFDVRSGSAYAVDAGARHVLGEPRAFATVSEFGDALLVAGGENPIHDVPVEQRVLRSSAEIYDPAARRFELELLTLREPRSRHAALVLPGGETLLVGGRGSFGTALATLEVVDPRTRSSSVALDPLSFGRIEPVALRLSDGRIFVGGGYDAQGEPVTALEWLAPDGNPLPDPVVSPQLPPRFDRAFVAMPGGAVLAAGGCVTRTPATPEECRSDAWWIAADGRAEEVELGEGVSAPRPYLLPGSDGSPWLFTGTETRRFNPFRARFERATSAPAAMPPAGLVAPVPVAPDHFFWINDDDPPALIGVRAGTRDRYARDVGLVFARQALDPGWPLHLAPDRNPQGKLGYDGALHFDDPEITVFVTDALYDDFALSVRFDGAAPVLVLGTVSCAWPEGADAEPLQARRIESSVVLTRGEASAPCPVGSGALALGLRAPDGESTVLGIEVQRR